MEEEIIEDIFYACTKGLDGQTSDCKLEMLANCFDHESRNMMYNLWNKHDRARNWTCLTSFNSFKSCVCMELFSVGCVSPVNKSAHTTNEMTMESEEEMNECMVF